MRIPGNIINVILSVMSGCEHNTKEFSILSIKVDEAIGVALLLAKNVIINLKLLNLLKRKSTSALSESTLRLQDMYPMKCIYSSQKNVYLLKVRIEIGIANLERY